MRRILAKNLDWLLIISIFLPYIPNGNGLRIEHIIVYAMFFFLLLTGRILKFKILPHNWVLLLYGLIFFHVTISSVLNSVDLDLKLIANFENYLETLVLFLILNSLLLNKDYLTPNRIRKLNQLFHVLLSINTVIILFEMFTPWADPLIKFYVQGGGETFRQDTNSLGRYTGVFDIIFAGGFAYSLGLLTWIYNFSYSKNKNLIFQVFLLIMILIGGFASVSKVFFLGGVLISLYVFLRIGNLKPKIGLTIVSTIVLILVVPFFIEDWKGFSLFEDFATKLTKGSALNTLSAGRLGSDSGIYSMALNYDASLFFGNGLTMGNLPYFDSEHVQFYYQGGIVAIIAYVILYTKNFRLTFMLGKSLRNEKILLQAVLLLSIFTAFGGPVLFMNRVRIFLFIQLFFLYKLCASTQIARSKQKSVILQPKRSLS